MKCKSNLKGEVHRGEKELENLEKENKKLGEALKPDILVGAWMFNSSRDWGSEVIYE